MFIDEGPPMAELLRRARSKGVMLDYTDRLLREVGKFLAPPLTKEQPLIDPLSQRELEVLQLIAAGKSNQEIADELVIAMGTVKRHVFNIFTKLDVKNRTEGVAQARELGLLE